MRMKNEYNYFVAHEFSKQERDDLRNAIEKAFEGTGLKAYYADVEVRQSHILEKIRDGIIENKFGIYDISTKKPNVFIELGIAMAAKKVYYIICRRGTEIPADLAGLDRIEYDSYKELTQIIKEKVKKVEIQRIKDEKWESVKEYEGLSDDEVFKKSVQFFSAKDLHHRFGEEVEDVDSLNKKVWSANLSNSCWHIIFGPYKELPEQGNYIVLFKMKTSENKSRDSFLCLDASGRGYSSRFVREADFNRSNKYQLFGLHFKYQGGQMEYRVMNEAHNGKIWIDYVAIIKLPILG